MANQELARLQRGDLIERINELETQMDMSANDVKVENTTAQIIQLPESMTYREGITWLERLEKEEESEVGINHRISCYPLDGAYALLKAIKELHGWSNLVPTPGFFGDSPPTMVTMNISKDETVQVPWGRMQIPNIHGYIELFCDTTGKDPGLVIAGTVQRRDEEKIMKLANLTEKMVNENSIYRNQAMSITLDWVREGRDYDPNTDGFKFLDLSNIDENNLIFDATTAEMLDVSLFSFIKNADACRGAGVPLKRGILLEGGYGTGKTMTAFVTAKMAVENDFTYIMVNDARDLEQVVRLSRRFAPCVLFCEDIDRVMTAERTHALDGLLNTIDGFQSKGVELILVMTTNHVEKIHKAMLRPGRLDSVMTLGVPDAAAIKRFITYYAEQQMDPESDLEEACELLLGRSPAVIREAIERAKVGAVTRLGVSEITCKVTGQDLVIAARSMARHLELLEEKPKTVTAFDQFATALGDRIGDAIKETLPCLELEG